MKALFRTLAQGTLRIIGPVLLLVSLSELMRKSAEAEKYYWDASPLIEQLISSQSGGEDAPAVPSVELEDRVRLTMSQIKLDQGWSFTTLRRLVIAGVIITYLGSILDKRWSGSRSVSPGAATAGREPEKGQR